MSRIQRRRWKRLPQWRKRNGWIPPWHYLSKDTSKDTWRTPARWRHRRTKHRAERGESSLVAALLVLLFLVWMSVIPLGYFHRLLVMGTSHRQVQLLNAVGEEIQQQAVRQLEQWLLPRLGHHLQMALEQVPAFRNELMRGRDPLPSEAQREHFFRRSFYIPLARVWHENHPTPVTDPRLNSVRHYLASLGTEVVVDMTYAGLAEHSRPDAPEYLLICQIRSLSHHADYGEKTRQAREGSWLCLFRPQWVREDDPIPTSLDFPVPTLYPVYEPDGSAVAPPGEPPSGEPPGRQPVHP